jgi:hypothetical protein
MHLAITEGRSGLRARAPGYMNLDWVQVCVITILTSCWSFKRGKVAQKYLVLVLFLKEHRRRRITERGKVCFLLL